jgi:GT2 family glycosyltransferase
MSLVAIDNCSEDESVLLLENMGIIPLVPERNLGYSAGINLGLSIMLDSDINWCFIINPDIAALEKNWAAKMLADLPDKCGIIGAKLLHGNLVVHGGGQILAQPTICSWTKDYDIGTKKLWVRECLGLTKVGHRVGHPNQYMKPELVPWTTFAVVALNMQMVREIGGLNEDYFLYSSDADYCFKAQRHGWKVYYQPVCFSHEAGGSLRTAPQSVNERGQEDIKLWVKREKEILEEYVKTS